VGKHLHKRYSTEGRVRFETTARYKVPLMCSVKR
jgi:hypothetical protein